MKRRYKQKCCKFMHLGLKVEGHLDDVMTITRLVDCSAIVRCNCRCWQELHHKMIIPVSFLSKQTDMQIGLIITVRPAFASV